MNSSITFSQKELSEELYFKIDSLHFSPHIKLKEIKKMAKSEKYLEAKKELEINVLKNHYKISEINISEVIEEIRNTRRKYFNESFLGFYDFIPIQNLRSIISLVLNLCIFEDVSSPLFSYLDLHIPPDGIFSNIEHHSLLFPNVLLKEDENLYLIRNIPIVETKNKIQRKAGNVRIGSLTTIYGEPLEKVFSRIINGGLNTYVQDYSNYIRESMIIIEKYSDFKSQKRIFIFDKSGKVSSTNVKSFEEAQDFYKNNWRPIAKDYYPFHLTQPPSRLFYELFDVKNTDRGLENFMQFLLYCENIVPIAITIPVLPEIVHHFPTFKKYIPYLGIKENEFCIFDYKTILSKEIVKEIWEIIEKIEIKNFNIIELYLTILEKFFKKHIERNTFKELPTPKEPENIKKMIELI